MAPGPNGDPRTFGLINGAVFKDRFFAQASNVWVDRAAILDWSPAEPGGNKSVRDRRDQFAATEGR